MAKTKISEFSTNPANNTDINGINIAEGCAPSGINNAIRQLMSDLKEFQTGAAGDDLTVGGNLVVTGTVTGTVATQPVSDDSTKIASTAFVRDIVPTGVIVMWSGASTAIPAGWFLCDGTNNTPDLRNRFIVGAGSTYAVGATGGSADAVVVSHTHTATVNDPGHTHSASAQMGANFNCSYTNLFQPTCVPIGQTHPVTVNAASTGISVTNSTVGESGTNKNLPPYYALAFIMKA